MDSLIVYDCKNCMKTLFTNEYIRKEFSERFIQIETNNPNIKRVENTVKCNNCETYIGTIIDNNILKLNVNNILRLEIRIEFE